MFVSVLLLALIHTTFAFVPSFYVHYPVDQWPACVQGRRFVYDHSSCSCSQDGLKMTCEKEMYSMVTPLLHGAQLQNISLTCKPGAQFHDLCRDCLCDDSGRYAACVPSKEYFRNQYCKETPQRCIPGSVFRHGCNGCICGSNGKATCTNLNCREAGIQSDTVLCVPNTEDVMFECNICPCTRDGKGMQCSKFDCGAMSFYHEHILNVTMGCQPNKIFNYKCHQCICDPKGHYAMCHGKQCSILDMTNDVDTVNNCKPGMIFSDKCNVCVCGQDGKGACTTLSCGNSYDIKYVEHAYFSRET